MKKAVLFLSFILIGRILVDDSLWAFNRKQASINVLLITVDTIRPDRFSCYSPKYLKTPHIDRLAAQGALFERAVAHNPLTLPSHVNIFLGTTPFYHGVHQNSNSIVAEDFLTLAEYLKSKEYSTAAFIGAFSLDSRFGLTQGFDVYDDSYPSKPSVEYLYPERKAEKVINKALDWIEEQDTPWFAWVHIWDPHVPYEPPEPFRTQFKDDLYSGEVAYVDSELGKMFDYLTEHNMMDKTLIVLTGDHGESLEEHGELTHGYFAYNSTLWVPLIFAGPGVSAIRIDEYVSHVDIFPTVCDILDMEKPPFLQGVSIVPLMRGKKIKERAIYFESLEPYFNRGWAPLRGYIEEGKKFIDSPLPEFYDLANDFDEENNLVQEIDLDKYRIKLKNMRETFSSPQKAQRLQKIDREALEKLGSLGYIVSPVSRLKESYGPEDDLKTLLPIQQKHSNAMILYNTEGRIAESVKLLSDVIEERKDFSKAYFDLARIYRDQRMIQDAIDVMERGLKNIPEDYSIISGYGIFLVQEGMLDKGIELLERALTLIDFDPDVWINLGIAFWQKGEYQKALENYEKALYLDHNDAVIFNNLGTLYLSMYMQTKKREDHLRSIENFQKAVELDPAFASAYNGLGSAHKVVGQNDEAIKAWEKSVELNPDLNFPVYNLGLAYLEKGDKLQALKYFEKYLFLKKNTISLEERRMIEDLIQQCKKNKE
jgi:arylsulfatase A-like enzyme/Flp pilus assembly protein TadD